MKKEPLISYINKFINLPLVEIVKNYNNIELEIIKDLCETLGSTLIKNGYKKHDDDVYSRDDYHFRILPEFHKKGRTLIITLHNLANRSHKTHVYDTQIEHFGLIRKLCIEFPCSPPIDPKLMLENLRTQVLMAYTALEQAFISNAEQLGRSVFKKLYDCLEAQLNFSNKQDLFGRCWLFIAERDVGFYFFDERIIRKVIKYYRQHQHEIYSPLELTIWIMTAPLPFQKSLAIEAWRAKKPLSLPWIEARYIDEAYKIFLAEVALYTSEKDTTFKKYTASTICENRGYFLVVAFPTDIEKEIDPEVTNILPLLKEHFQGGLNEWSPYMAIVKQITKLSHDSGVASFIGTLLGAAVAEYSKRAPKL